MEKQVIKATRTQNSRGPVDTDSNHGPRYSSESDRRRSSEELMGQPSQPVKLAGKSYRDITAQCLRDRRLFEDPDFPATDLSISKRKRPRNPPVWKRPGVSRVFTIRYGADVVTIILEMLLLHDICYKSGIDASNG